MKSNFKVFAILLGVLFMGCHFAGCKETPKVTPKVTSQTEPISAPATQQISWQSDSEVTGVAKNVLSTYYQGWFNVVIFVSSLEGKSASVKNRILQIIVPASSIDPGRVYESTSSKCDVLAVLHGDDEGEYDVLEGEVKFSASPQREQQVFSTELNLKFIDGSLLKANVKTTQNNFEPLFVFDQRRYTDSCP